MWAACGTGIQGKCHLPYDLTWKPVQLRWKQKASPSKYMYQWSFHGSAGNRMPCSWYPDDRIAVRMLCVGTHDPPRQPAPETHHRLWVHMWTSRRPPRAASRLLQPTRAETLFRLDPRATSTIALFHLDMSTSFRDRNPLWVLLDTDSMHAVAGTNYGLPSGTTYLRQAVPITLDSRYQTGLLLTAPTIFHPTGMLGVLPAAQSQ